MMEEKKNRCVLVFTVIALLLSVLIIAIVLVLQNQKNKSGINVTFKQIYLTDDYELEFLNNDYFYAAFDNKMVAVIDQKGKEVFNSNEGIYFNGIYKLKSGNYLLYSNTNNNLVTYTFDGKHMSTNFSNDNVGNVKPIINIENGIEYLIGFVANKNDNIYLYGIDNSVVVIKNSKFIGDKLENDVYYVYNDNFFAVEDGEGLRGVIDSKGNTIVDIEYLDIINTSNNNFIALNKKNKYGVINEKNETIIEFDYKVIYEENSNYLLVNKKNKMALYNANFEKIIGFKMNYNVEIDFDLRSTSNSVKVEVIDDNVLVVNNYLEDVNEIEYQYHDMYVIGEDEIVENIKQVGYGFDNLFYTYDSSHKLKFYSNSEVIELELNDASKINTISKVSENTVEIIYYNNENNLVKKYYNFEMEEVSFTAGDLVINNDDYFGYIKDGDIKTLIIMDKDNNEVRSIKGNNFKINNKFIIVDNGIYEIVER